MLFALSALVDVALVAFLVTHTTGSVSDLALSAAASSPCGACSPWSSGWSQPKVDLITAAGPRLLQNH